MLVLIRCRSIFQLFTFTIFFFEKGKHWWQFEMSLIRNFGNRDSHLWLFLKNCYYTVRIIEINNRKSSISNYFCVPVVVLLIIDTIQKFCYGFLGMATWLNGCFRNTLRHSVFSLNYVNNYLRFFMSKNIVGMKKLAWISVSFYIWVKEPKQWLIITDF